MNKIRGTRGTAATGRAQASGVTPPTVRVSRADKAKFAAKIVAFFGRDEKSKAKRAAAETASVETVATKETAK